MQAVSVMRATPRPASSFSALLDPAIEQTPDWDGADLAAMLSHQLRQPLSDIVAPPAGGRHASRSLFELLCGGPEAGWIEALMHVKAFAKTSLAADADESALPEPVARVLYVLTLSACPPAQLHAFSSLRRDDVVRETRRCLTLTWLGDDVRELLRRATSQGAGEHTANRGTER